MELCSFLLNKAASGMDYLSYREAVRQAVMRNGTTGNEQTEVLAAYTVLNHVRMDRWDRTLTLRPDLTEQLRQIEGQTWLVLTEGWCGDAAQNLPFIARMASEAKGVHLRILGRDAHPDLMDLYLTNTTRSIPKLIAVNGWGHELFQWGPRPGPAQRMVMENKDLPEGERLHYEDISRALHTWYARDKGARIQQEFLELLKT
ncbi:MAG: thioredoxin family protein [Flavobacteriales bacterium]|nr:thioredoxin family protein [Flavobacteriales bacterium]